MTTDNNLCRKLGAQYSAEQAARIEQDFVAMNEAEFRARYRSNAKRLIACGAVFLGLVCFAAFALDATARGLHDAAIVRAV